jgi:hypothetical protein
MTAQSKVNTDLTTDVNALLAEAQKSITVPDALLQALTIMAAREVRIAQKEEALEVQRKAVDAERKKESERYIYARMEAQTNCKHLKGGAFRSKGQQKDPAVYAHTFTNGDTIIKCNLCGAKWTPLDTEDFLSRNGHKVPNWTKIGWRKAAEMLDESSNRASSSEQFFRKEASSIQKEVEKIEVPNLQI